MAYLGNRPADSYLSLEKQTFTTSATASYTLTNAVSNANEIALFLNNVRQEPTEAYSVSGTALTLSTAITSGDTMYCIYLGKSIGTINPADGSVGLSQLSATGTKDATTFLRGDNTFDTPAGGVNTPAFQAKKLTTQSFSTNITAVVLFDSEDFDTASAYDTVTGKFTPQTAGKYLIHGQIAFTYSGGNDYIVITKNGTAIKWGQNYPSGTAQYKKQDTSVILELNGTTDYVQIEGLTSYVGTNTLGTSLLGTGDACTFYGYKIIE